MERNRILIADDYPGMTELYEMALEGEIALGPVEIESFKDGTSLEKRLRKGEKNVRLVLTDYDMPGVNGGEIIKRYARLPEYSETRFILITGHQDAHELGKKAIENGAFSYIAKEGATLKPIIDAAKEAFKKE